MFNRGPKGVSNLWPVGKRKYHASRTKRCETTEATNSGNIVILTESMMEGEEESLSMEKLDISFEKRGNYKGTDFAFASKLNDGHVESNRVNAILAIPPPMEGGFYFVKFKMDQYCEAQHWFLPVEGDERDSTMGEFVHAVKNVMSTMGYDRKVFVLFWMEMIVDPAPLANILSGTLFATLSNPHATMLEQSPNPTRIPLKEQFLYDTSPPPRVCVSHDELMVWDLEDLHVEAVLGLGRSVHRVLLALRDQGAVVVVLIDDPHKDTIKQKKGIVRAATFFTK